MNQNNDKSKLNPAEVYKHPNHILSDTKLSRKEKIELLKQWAYDEKEILVAEEENMQPNVNHNQSKLDDILKALRELDEEGGNSSAPTKQG